LSDAPGGWRRLETREALLLAFFAGFALAARAALRWHLHITGHSMFATAFFLVLARSSVDRRFAATTSGALVGLASAALGMGKSGPLLIPMMALPGLVVDLAAWVGGAATLRRSLLRGAVIGAGAGAITFFPTAAVELLLGIELRIVWLHALVAASAKAGFGALGGAAGAYVARELEHHGLLTTRTTA
jgi:hypothetical protein